MHRRAFLSALIVVVSASRSRAAEWSLITDEEFRREQAAPHIEESFALPPQGAPIIDILEPDQTKTIKSPVTIRVRFQAQDGAVIDKSSFHVTYGFLGIDITRKIVDHAQLTEQGITATDAQLPSGHHKVTLQIADNRRRVATQTFEFTVA
jgi:hypothetical protein